MRNVIIFDSVLLWTSCGDVDRKLNLLQVSVCERDHYMGDGLCVFHPVVNSTIRKMCTGIIITQ